MGVRIIYGGPGSGKSEFCFSEIANQLKKEKKIYMITPDQFSFTAEQKLMKATHANAVIHAEVVSLSRMAYRVLNEVGGSIKTYLSQCGKAMLIYDILNKYKKELKFLGKSDENINLSMEAIAEFKKYGITPIALQQEIDTIQDTYLKTKLRDMVLIYQKFQEKIEGRYIEENDLLNILATQIEKTNLLQNSIIYLDEFSGFTKQEYEVIKQFIKLAKQVNISICTDNLNINTNPDSDIFYPNKITIAKIWNMVNENNFQLDKPVHLQKQHRFKTEELRYLSINRNSYQATRYEKKVENIKLFLAQNPYSEIEHIDKQIIQLRKDKKMRYKDIAIITKNIDEYSSLIRAIFSKYKIPVFIDEKRDVNQNIIIQYILSLLEIINKNFATETIFNYLKLGFSSIDLEEIFELENYCNKWGIKQNKWKKDFVYEREKEDRKQKVERYNQLREQIVQPLLELQGKIKQNRTASHITKYLYEFLQNQKIEEKIIAKIHKLEEKSLLDLANEYSTSYKILLAILDEMILVFGDDKMTIDQ